MPPRSVTTPNPVRRHFLLLTYATCKPLISWGRRNVVKLTIYATSGKKIDGIGYVVLSNVWWLGSFESLVNAMACFEHQTKRFKVSHF